MSTWTTRLYQPGDEETIKTLYELVFETPMPLDLWRWRYLENPTKRVTILLAEAENKTLAGQYALCPLPMKMGSEDVVGTLSLDTMVHPDFRGKGMFVALANDLYARIAGDGIPIVYGFPNEQSQHGFTTRLQWRNLVETVPIYIRPLNFAPLAAKLLPGKAFPRLAAPIVKLGYQVLRGPRGRQYRAYRVRQVPDFDERIDSLWRRARDIAPILVRRDRSYLTWRYTKHPINRYTIFVAEQGDDLLGYAALGQQEVVGLSTGFIADLLTVPDAEYVADALIEATVAHSKTAGWDMVSCLMLPHSPYTAALKRRGFMLTPPGRMPQEMHLGARNNSPTLSEEFICASENWYISWGDHDRV